MPAQTIRARIIDTVLTALRAVPSVPDGNVEFARDGDPVDFNSLSLDDLGEDFVEQDALSRRATLRLSVIGDVEGDGGDDLNANVQQLLGELFVELGRDPQWDGLADDTELGDVAVQVTPDASSRQAAFSLELGITYAHRRADPAAQ